MSLECPYCNHEMEAPDDAHEENYPYEGECQQCEKAFIFRVSYAAWYTATQADCLNGGDHQYERTRTWPREYARMRCKTCEHERPMTTEEAARVEG